MDKSAAADVGPRRQRTQYTCMTTSMTMCLHANGMEATEDEVNKVMGAKPMQGASWEQAFAAAQHYGMRVTFICPATLKQIKEYTDGGVPVMIAWNPEGRPWSHASVVFDVDDEMNVSVADPNIPDPDETVRMVTKTEFYGKWYEKWPDYMVRRPAMAVEREVTSDGRQMVASRKTLESAMNNEQLASRWLLAKKAPQNTTKTQDEKKREKNKVTVEPSTPRSDAQRKFIEDRAKGTGGSGVHKNRDKAVEEGRSRKGKHKKDWTDREAAFRPEWEMVKPFHGFVNEAFLDKVKANPAFREILHNGGGRVTLYMADYFPEDTQYNGGSEYDVHFAPSNERPGMWRINVGMTKGMAVLNKLAEILRIRPVRTAGTNPLSTRPDYGSSESFGALFEEARQAAYDGNPDGESIYPKNIDHGVDTPLSGGTDVVQQLQNDLLDEQGNAYMKRKLALRFMSQG